MAESPVAVGAPTDHRRSSRRSLSDGVGLRGSGHHRTHDTLRPFQHPGFSTHNLPCPRDGHSCHPDEFIRDRHAISDLTPPEVPALGAQPTAQSWASEAESTSSESQPIPVSPGTGTEKSTTANVPAQQGSPITIQIDPLRIENLPPVVGPLDPVDPDTPDTPAVTAPTDTQTTPTQPSNPTDTTDPVVPNPDMPVMPFAPRPGMPS
ncbi:hypothetical protein ACETU7_31340 [Rhodococcus sp. 3Y1]